MKRKNVLEEEIIKKIAKLSQIEFIGLVRFFNIDLVKIDKDKDKDENKVRGRDFEELIQEVLEKINKLNRKQKKTLLKLLNTTTKGRQFTGNQVNKKEG